MVSEARIARSLDGGLCTSFFEEKQLNKEDIFLPIEGRKTVPSTSKVTVKHKNKSTQFHNNVYSVHKLFCEASLSISNIYTQQNYEGSFNL